MSMYLRSTIHTRVSTLDDRAMAAGFALTTSPDGGDEAVERAPPHVLILLGVIAATLIACGVTLFV